MKIGIKKNAVVDDLANALASKWDQIVLMIRIRRLIPICEVPRDQQKQQQSRTSPPGGESSVEIQISRVPKTL